jgi:uncharacterized protein
VSEPFSFLTDEGLPIRGDLHLPASPGPLVVCVHGFKGFKDWGFWPETARRLHAAGYAVVRFNFSHSGIGEDLEDFGEPALFESGTYSREVADLRAVLSWLSRGTAGDSRIDLSRIGFLGHSRGSVASLAVAASGEFPVRSVVLWNPVSRLLWWSEEERRRWRTKGYWEVVNARTGQVFRVTTALLDDAEGNGERLEPIVNAGRLETRLLVVVARADESVPPESGVRLAREAPAPLGSLVEIPDTGHTFGATHPFAATPAPLEEAIRATIEHFDRTLREAA